jgi:hypothetical protein
VKVEPVLLILFLAMAIDNSSSDDVPTSKPCPTPMGEIIYGTTPFWDEVDTDVNVPFATLMVVVHPTLRFKVIL